MTKTDTDSSQIRNFFLRVTIELAWVLVNTQHDFQFRAMVFHVRKAAKKGCLSRRGLLSMCVCVAVHICMHSDLGGLQVGLLDVSASDCVPQVPHTSDLEAFL